MKVGVTCALTTRGQVDISAAGKVCMVNGIEDGSLVDVWNSVLAAGRGWDRMGHVMFSRMVKDGKGICWMCLDIDSCFMYIIVDSWFITF